jgi:putative hydrolase of the HAD superfamily
MNRRPGHACFFDAFGTLLYPRIPVHEVYHQVAARYGETRTCGEIRQALRHAMEDVDTSRTDRRSSGQLERDYWRRVVGLVFGELPSKERIFEELWAAFADPSAWCLFPDVLPTLREMAHLGFPAGIASNVDGRLHKICRQLFPGKLLRWIFISAEVGWRKPDLRFFREVQRRCGFSADELWMIGDSWKSDIRPAAELGWNAALIDRGDGRSAGVPMGVCRIQRLDEVIPLLTA